MRKISTVIFMMLTVGLTAIGCHQQAEHSPYRLGVAKQLYDQRQYNKAEETLSHFILAGDADGATVCEAYYLRGLSRRNQGESKNAEAESDFVRAIATSCHPTIKGLAHVGLGHIHFEQGLAALTKAKFHYLAALKYLESAEPKDAVLYRLGVTLQRLGHWSEADKYLQQCADDFGTSLFAAQAKRRVGAKVFQLQAGAFSDMNRARQQIAQLQQKGWRFNSIAQTINGKTLYMVRSGRYVNYQMAMGQLERLAGSGPKAIIVTSP